MIQSLPALRQQFFAEKQSHYEFPDDDPRKARHLSLEQMKKQSKDLLKLLRKNEQWDRFQKHRPDAKDLTADSVKLADVQWLLAQEHGFSSWAKLKHHIEAAEISRQAIASDSVTALDSDKKTLHIRCGNDIMNKLAVAGFSGDFLNFSDPYIQGPVPQTKTLEEFIEIRAQFIANEDWLSYEQAINGLSGDYAALEQAVEYERITFWFEHDAYDVLIFMKLLHFFSETSKRAPEMRYICVTHYPGVQRFNGIGQLPADAMRVLWGQFSDLEDDQFEFGKLAWEAFTAPTPEELGKLVYGSKAALPEVLPALKRHLQQLPDPLDGLNLTERLTLRILDLHGRQNAARLFYDWYTTRFEPLTFMGDSSYWIVLDKLASAEHPAIKIDKKSERKIDWQVTLTDFGKQLIAGEISWADFNSYDCWLGGVHNQGRKGIWYWDQDVRHLKYK